MDASQITSFVASTHQVFTTMLSLTVTAGKPLAEGDLEFVEDAADTRYDAFMKIGPRAFLILNHTVRTMAEIRTDPGWLSAQGVLFELGERFRQDPFATA